ncbi:hypothetical protein B4U79_12918 [Dinothrombium tinctorium]|uniref:Uncharacterized protein n=1 Tax=Dinothrombium tinctorium TaxID=1965070 RepID=A0A3S3P3U1_9ACAR|nr:hypothetical protein B4U79_12918 [Dinothrombium tinctorium]
MSAERGEKCYVCGQHSNSLFVLHSQPNEEKAPFFPFLLALRDNERNATATTATTTKCCALDASVIERTAFKVCSVCIHTLLQQWNEFEKKKLPHNKRIYLLNGQAFAPPSEATSNNSTVAIGSALDLSLPGKGSKARSDNSKECRTIHENLSLKEAVNWTPTIDTNRNYSLSVGNKSPESRSSPPLRLTQDRKHCSKLHSNRKPICCVICGANLPIDMQITAISVIETSSDSINENKLVLNTAQEIILTSELVLDVNRVLICVVCFKKLLNQQKQSQEIESGAVLRRKLTDCNEMRQCQVCHRLVNEDKGSLVHTSSNHALQLGGVCYPFLKELIRAQEASDTFGRVFLCNFCQSSLSNQMESFEKAHIPLHQREYRLTLPKEAITIPKSPEERSNSPTRTLHIQVASPPLYNHSSHVNDEPLLTTVVTPTINVFVNSKSSSEERLKVSGLADIIPALQSRPLPDCTSCQVCGDIDITYKILLNKDEREPELPYFPSLQRCLPTNDEVSHALNSSNHLLVCTFCYHSLIAQWIAYETSSNNEDVDANRRIYNVVNYVCYICGVTTYRNRIKSITVKDFPFLVDHSRPAGALSINGGESVITCLTCFDTLISQWRDFERMKVPLEMRKYNWIALPMPPE